MSNQEIIAHMSAPGGCAICGPEASTEVIITRHHRVLVVDICRRTDELKSRWATVRSGMVKLMTDMENQPKINWPPLHRWV